MEKPSIIPSRSSVIKSVIKRAIQTPLVTRVVGSRMISKLALKKRTSVFLYHEVSPEPSEFHQQFDLNVRPEIFEEHVRLILQNFNVITPLELMSGGYDTPAALITFDDGTRGIFDHALPILERYSTSSLIFLNMGPVEGHVFWAGLVAYLCTYRPDFVRYVNHRVTDAPLKQIPLFLRPTPTMVEQYLDEVDRAAIYTAARNYYGEFASPEDLSMAETSNLVYFANHLFNHYNCARLTAEELRDIYLKNQVELEKYGNAVPIFSYPFGQPGSCFNSQTSKLLQELGAKLIFTAFPRIERLDQQTLIHRVAPPGALQSAHAFMSWLHFVLLKQYLASRQIL
jgi:hypothetical protein